MKRFKHPIRAIREPSGTAGLLENCTNFGINGTYTVTGSVKSTTVDGATLSLTQVNHDGTEHAETLRRDRSWLRRSRVIQNVRTTAKPTRTQRNT
jgi:hypothetical protein